MENEEGKAFRKEDEAKAEIGENTSKRDNNGGKSFLDEDLRYAGPHTKALCFSKHKLQLFPEGYALRRKLNIPSNFSDTCHYSHYDPEKAKYRKRFHRNHDTSLFRDCYKFVKGRKILISSQIDIGRTGKHCYDSSWVAVHGFDSICVVTFRKAVDIRRVPDYCYASRSEKEALLDFTEAVISEVECIPYNDFPYNRDILRQLCSGKVVKPFGVVSLVMDTGKSWKEAKDPVCNFLKQKMQDSCLAFTNYETLQTAIGAFQHMCPGKELTAKDIWVTIMDVSSGRFDHLDVDTRTEQLDIVNGIRSPPKSPLKPLFVSRGPPMRTPYPPLRPTSPL